MLEFRLPKIGHWFRGINGNVLMFMSNPRNHSIFACV